MQFVSIDPGKHVGIALCNNLNIFCDIRTLCGVTSDDTLEELCEYIEARIRFLDYIVVEAFKMVSFHGQNLEAIEQIGVIKLISRVNNVPYVLQQPSVRKSFESRACLCSTPHEKSAIAHGLYFLNKMKVKV